MVYLDYFIVSAWVLIPLANHNPAIFSVPPGTEKLDKSPQTDKNPDNFSVFYVFNNNT